MNMQDASRKKIKKSICTNIKPDIYRRSRINQGFTQSMGLRHTTRGLIDLKMPFHYKLSAVLTLFPKINVPIKGSVKLRIVYNVVLLNKS